MISHYLTDHADALLFLSLISIVLFSATIICIPLIVIRLQDDFFIRNTRKAESFRSLPLHCFMVLLKNVAGIFLLTAGFIMLFIPGQGLLTIVMGLALINFPWKKKLELRLLKLSCVQNALNWIRRKNALKEFKFP